MAWVSGLPPLARDIVEEPEFTAALESIGSLELIDRALTGFYWAVSTNPTVFEVVPGTQDTRLARTRAIGETPALRIWFRIENGDHTVRLLTVETIDDLEL